jgi:hypothetical protein
VQKLKSCVETYTPFNQIFIFKEDLCTSNIFDADQAQINSAYHLTGGDGPLLIEIILPLCKRRRGFWPYTQKEKEANHRRSKISEICC